MSSPQNAEKIYAALAGAAREKREEIIADARTIAILTFIGSYDEFDPSNLT